MSDSREVRVPLVDDEQELPTAAPVGNGIWFSRPPLPQPKSWWKEHYLRLPERKMQVPGVTNLWGLLCHPYVLAAETLVLCRFLVCYDIAMDLTVSSHIDREQDPAWFCVSVFLILLPIAIKCFLFKRLCLQVLERPISQGGYGWQHDRALIAYVAIGWLFFALLDYYLLLFYPWVSPTDYEVFGPFETLSPIIETFFESIEQTGLQLWMCYRLKVLRRNTNQNMQTMLLFSVLPGLFNIGKKLNDLKKAANVLGMGFCEYVSTLVYGPLGITAPFVELLAKREDLSYKNYGELFEWQQRAIFQALGPQNKVMRRIEFDDLNRVQLQLLAEHVRGNAALRHLELGRHHSIEEIRELFQAMSDLNDLDITIAEGVFSSKSRQLWLLQAAEHEGRAELYLEREFLGKDLAPPGEVLGYLNKFLKETGATSWGTRATLEKRLACLTAARRAMRPRELGHATVNGKRLEVTKKWVDSPSLEAPASTRASRRQSGRDPSARKVVLHLMRVAAAKAKLSLQELEEGSPSEPERGEERAQLMQELERLQSQDVREAPEPKPALPPLVRQGVRVQRQLGQLSNGKTRYCALSRGRLELHKDDRQGRKPDATFSMKGATCEFKSEPWTQQGCFASLHVTLPPGANQKEEFQVALAAKTKQHFKVSKNAVKCARYLAECLEQPEPDRGERGLRLLVGSVDSPAGHLHKAWDQLFRIWRLLGKMDEVNEAPKEPFQQSVLFEVWSVAGLIQSRKFLGECWLPNLCEFAPQMKDTLLPLKEANFRNDAEPGPSRWDKAKEELGGQAISGTLHVSVGWTFPVGEPQDAESASLQARTGRMELRITAARSLRRAQQAFWRACDPQVLVWIRNDHTKTWRKAPSAKTSYVINTRNPHFGQEFTLELVDGPGETAL